MIVCTVPKIFFIKLGIGFGIRDPEKTYSGPRTQGKKDTGSRIRKTATLDFWLIFLLTRAGDEVKIFKDGKARQLTSKMSEQSLFWREDLGVSTSGARQVRR